MARFSFFLVILILAGCQPVHRFPPLPAKQAKAKAEVKPIVGWQIPRTPPRDLPIRFVSSDQPEWANLSSFWNFKPHPAAGTRTSHIGQYPLGALAGFVLLEGAEAMVVKVPRGLPDPTPHIPASNPPTFGKWRLGKKIFFERVLQAGSTSLACADCHHPGHGFADASPVSLEGTRNTLSLLNVVYNRDQFWDGRVRTLEETLAPSLDDELEDSRVKVLRSHRWGGVARRLNLDKDMLVEFKAVFGTDAATQDAVAKALATYMRTILSGDSVYDRARAEAPAKALPTVEHFKKVLGDDAMKGFKLPEHLTGISRDALAEKIARGQEVFHGKGGCVLCHPPGVFTNHQFYNVLLDDSSNSQALSGKETGRFAVLPIGGKDPSLRGAYRTPTLRNLSATAPYFHNGSRADLQEAIDHFRKHLDKDAPLLAEPLRQLLARTPPAFEGGAPSLFEQDEALALRLFLISLDGQGVDPLVGNK